MVLPEASPLHRLPRLPQIHCQWWLALPPKMEKLACVNRGREEVGGDYNSLFKGPLFTVGCFMA